MQPNPKAVAVVLTVKALAIQSGDISVEDIQKL